LVGFLVGFRHKTDPFLNVLEKLLFFLPQTFRRRLLDMMRHFNAGLVPAKNKGRFVLAVFYSLLLWFSVLWQIELVTLGLGLSLPHIATFIVLAMASFGAMIPSAPGFIGTFHLSVLYGFLLFGFAREEALSAAILWHATMFFPTLAAGFGFLLFEQGNRRRSEGNRDTI
jgi:uncharacterized protein (TIRG00374 family)